MYGVVPADTPKYLCGRAVDMVVPPIPPRTSHSLRFFVLVACRVRGYAMTVLPGLHSTF